MAADATSTPSPSNSRPIKKVIRRQFTDQTAAIKVQRAARLSSRSAINSTPRKLRYIFVDLISRNIQWLFGSVGPTSTVSRPVRQSLETLTLYVCAPVPELTRNSREPPETVSDGFETIRERGARPFGKPTRLPEVYHVDDSRLRPRHRY